MLSLKKSKKRAGSRIVVLFDIGSASIAGAVVFFQTGKKPNVLYHTRKSMKLQEELDFDRFLASMLQTLNSVAQDVGRKGLGRIHTGSEKNRVNHILVTYSSPWHMSQSKTIKIENKKGTTITRRLIDELIKKEENLLAKSSAGEYGSSADDGIDVIERAVTDICLDGYSVTDPYGKKPKHAEFSLSLTVMSAGLRDSVESVLEKHLSKRPMSHRSFALVSFNIVRDLFGKAPNFLLVDVSGEVTDISVVRGNALRDNVSFPKGKHFIYRALKRELGVSLDEAVSTLRALNTGSVSQKTGLQLEQALYVVQEEWTRDFTSALEKIESGLLIPRTVFLTAGEDVESLIKRFITEEQWGGSTRTGGGFTVTGITGGGLVSHVESRGGALKDPFIGLEALYVDKLTSLV